MAEESFPNGKKKIIKEGSLEHQKGRNKNWKSKNMSKCIHVLSPLEFSKLRLVHEAKIITLFCGSQCM